MRIKRESHQHPAPTAPRESALRLAVDAFCKQCIYEPDKRPHWRVQVHNCPNDWCPLYNVRPTADQGGTREN